MHYTNIQVRFKTGILKLNLCNYSDAHMLFKGTITVVNTATADANANNTNKKVIFKTLYFIDRLYKQNKQYISR